MTSSIDLLAATGDPHLLARAAALLGADGDPIALRERGGARAAVELAMDRVVAQDVQDGQCIADVYARAAADYAPTPLPGEDPSAVTDEHLRAALHALGLLGTPPAAP